MPSPPHPGISPIFNLCIFADLKESLPREASLITTLTVIF